MDNIEYYKSLISDEEVIRALIKESKARDGELIKEKTRIRPNLNFFQRTVTNLVSSNKRITTKHEDVISKERKKYVRKIKTPHTLMKEILLANKINFVKAEQKESTDLKVDLGPNRTKQEETIVDLNQTFCKNDKLPKSDSLPKISGKRQSINFKLNLDKSRFVDKASTSISENLSHCSKRRWSSSTDSSGISVISICSSKSNHSASSPDIIKISDSDSDCDEQKSLNKSHVRDTRICKHKNKTKLRKKRKRRKDAG